MPGTTAPEIPFDAIATFFVLLIGLPALVLQSLPPETRRVLEKRAGRLITLILIPILVAAGLGGVGVVAHHAGLWREGPLWSSVLTAIAIVCLVSAFYLPRRYVRRHAVARWLREEVSARLAVECRLVEDALHDLVEFGQQSAPVREKLFALDALDRLAIEVTEHPDYAGEALTDLVSGVVAIVVESEGEGREPLLRLAVDALERPVRAFVPDGDDAFAHVDAAAAIHGMSVLGIESLTMRNRADTQLVTQTLSRSRGERDAALTTARSQALFEVGTAALEAHDTLSAMKALDGLVSLIYTNAPAEGELVRDTVGLLAHFWTAGPTGREFAGQRLRAIEGALRNDAEGVIDATIEHCAVRALFRTADKLRSMRAQWEIA